MKKVKRILLLMILIGCLNSKDVLAAGTVGEYNGNGNTVKGNASTTCGGVTSGPCTYNNANHLTLKVTLYYINNGTYSKAIHTEYWTNDSEMAQDSNIDKKSFLPPDTATGNKDYKSASNAVNNYFQGNNWANAKTWFYGYVSEEDRLESEKMPGKKGYRIVIEPIVTYVWNGNTKKIYYDTIKNVTVFRLDYSLTGMQVQIPKRYSEMLNSLTLERSDVGISTSSTCAGESKSALTNSAKYTVGCGMNMIDVTFDDLLKPKCPSDSVQNPGMDLTKCVDNYVKNKVDKETAKNLCRDQYCTLKCPAPWEKTDISACVKDYTNKQYTNSAGKTAKYTRNDAIDICKMEKGCYSASCDVDNCDGKKGTKKISDNGTGWQASVYNRKQTLDTAIAAFKNSAVCKSCCYAGKDGNPGNLKCTTDLNKKILFSSNYQSTTAGSCEVVQENVSNKYGRYVGMLGQCRIYCNDYQVDVELPGNLKQTFKAGTSFVWPTANYNDKFAPYRMKTLTKTKCTAIHPTKNGASCGTLSSGFVGNYYASYNNSASINYNDKKYGKTINLISNVGSTCDKCGKALKDYDPIYLTSEAKFKLPINLNSYIDQRGEFFDNKNASGAVLPLILNRSEGSLAISKDSYGRFNLKINLKLGFNNKIGSKLNDYVCSYNVLKNSDECVCPDGTTNAGMDITDLAKCKNKACTMAQYEWCNKEINIDDYKDKCTCEYSGKEVDLTDCMNKGNSFQYCYNQSCKSICDTTKCSWQKAGNLSAPNSITVYEKKCTDGEICDVGYFCPGCTPDKPCDMDPTQCLQTKLGYKNLYAALKKGWISVSEFNRALLTCEKVACPNGKKIIYRVIDLDNPFPGMQLKGSTNAFTNTNTKGRYPGYNWNNQIWVKNKILNVNAKVRSVRSYDIYKQEPLYTIKLTPSDIKDIRRYNDSHPYLPATKDYDCAQVCTSNFLRKSEYSRIFTGGLCKSAMDKNGLRNCYENYSSSSSKATYQVQ